ncbi:MAG: VWA domain-containing protein [Anaerolineae bacterium]|nr:VWA domain-containing protein [Anaerolineae bacterium]
MNYKIFTRLLIAAAIAVLGAACVERGIQGPPPNAELIEVMASTNLEAWLADAAAVFNHDKLQSAAGKTYYVQITYMDAGNAVKFMGAGKYAPDLWIADSYVWAEVMADQGKTDFLNNCQSVAESPLVFAVWKSLAESLGWPGRELGWLDIGSLAADPSAWGYYSGGQFGPTLRLGHAHPGLSAAGTNTLLAVVHAAQSKQAAVSVADIEEPIVQASVSAFESSVSTFSKSTRELGELMQERGVFYLGAAVVYENIVFEYSGGEAEIVPVYPFEGTFVADFPACVNQSAGADAANGAALFRDHLLGETGQKKALAHGLRPVSEALSEGADSDMSAILDLAKPVVIFENPSVETVYAAQDLWQASRKAVNMVMIIDNSGSMNGEKIESVKRAAVDFVDTMGIGDYATIITFDGNNQVTALIENAQIGASRQQIIDTIQALYSGGGTPLYDSIGYAGEIISRITSGRTKNVLVVLTDGMDTASARYNFNQDLIRLATGNDTTIYAIAYGDDADEELLANLAREANGNFYLGDLASIAAIYEEMSVIMGGSAGIGR